MLQNIEVRRRRVAASQTVPVEKVGADHEARPALACLAVNHSYVLLVFVQPPAVQTVSSVSLQIIRIMIIIKSFLLSAQANFKQIALKKCCSACPLYGRKKPH